MTVRMIHAMTARLITNKMPSNLMQDQLRMRACGHFRSRDKDGGHTVRSAVVENSMLHAKFMALCFILPIEVLHCGNRDFRPRPFWLLWPWTWPDDLHIRTWPVFPGNTPMCEYEHPSSRLSKVCRQTIRTNIHTRPTYHARFAGSQQHAASRTKPDLRCFCVLDIVIAIFDNHT